MTPREIGHSGERMRDAVGDILKDVIQEKKTEQAEKQAALRRRFRQVWRNRLYLALASLVFAGALVYSIPRWKHPFPPPTAAEADRGAREAIYFAIGVVERFSSDRGRLPISLEETRIHLPGIDYRITADGYELSAPVEDGIVTFRSGEDPAAFRAGRR